MFDEYYMADSGAADGVDRLSGLPEELLDRIFYFCSENSRWQDGRVYIQYRYHHDHRLYQEYIGDMRNGAPHGTGTVYQGRSYFDEVRDEYLDTGFQTPWLFLPLLYVYPRFEPTLSLLPSR